MIQRKTQTLAYWQKQFLIDTQDIEFVYNQILEKSRLFTFDDLAVRLIKRHCDLEELESRDELQQGKLYQPKDNFEVDDRVVFPFMEYAVGTVKYVRDAKHPDYGQFKVIGVAIDPQGEVVREFASNFHHPHPLNATGQSLSSLQGLMSPETLYQTYHTTIQPKVQAALAANDDFVEFHGQYFLQDLLIDFHEGLFNIADAAIDINNGPLGVDALIEQMGLLATGEEITDIMRFFGQLPPGQRRTVQ